tara:strand:- start:35503 stop:36300 length:798 start_codon:yes stop_codon:yes gene_type:complete
MQHDNSLHPIDPGSLSEALTQAQLKNDPFPYLIIDNLFASDFYSRLLASIPPISQAAKVSDSISRITLVPDPYSDNADWSYKTLLTNTPDLYKFWDSFTEFLNSPSLIQQLLEILKISYSSSYTMSARLAYDSKGSGLGPHRDREDKVASFIFYLASPQSCSTEIDSGTELLVPKVLRDSYSDKHYKFSEFRTVKKIHYKPNRLFAFAVKRGENGVHSFHGYRQTTRSTRMSIKFHIHKTVEKTTISNMIASTKRFSKDWESENE